MADEIVEAVEELAPESVDEYLEDVTEAVEEVLIEATDDAMPMPEPEVADEIIEAIEDVTEPLPVIEEVAPEPMPEEAEYEPAPEPEEEVFCFTMYMSDSYGDGWNGNYFEIEGQTGTVESGYSAEEEVCLTMGCHDLFVGGSNW